MIFVWVCSLGVGQMWGLSWRAQTTAKVLCHWRGSVSCNIYIYFPKHFNDNTGVMHF